MGLLSITLWGVFTLVVFIISFVIYNVQSHSKYFAKHNIPYMGGAFSLFFKMIIGKVNMLDIEKQMYNKARQYKSPIVGLSDHFFGFSAGVFVMDAELLKNIFVKDFDHFANRRSFGCQESDFYMKRMLFFKNGEGWKGLRMKMSPTFTTGKIRRMFKTFKKASESMTSYMGKHIGAISEQDVSMIFPKFTMDVIANLAFGLDSKAWEVPFGQSSTFEKMGTQFTFKFSPSMIIKLIVMNAAPKVADIFGFETFDQEAQNYFSEIVKDVIKRRRQTGEKMNDFIQLMLDAQEGLLKADEEANQVMYGSPEGNDDVHDGFATDSPKFKLEDDDLLANSLLFFLAGFDGTHVMMQWAAYALALYPEVQEKLFEEISSKLNANDGELTYESVSEMTYLEMVLNGNLIIKILVVIVIFKSIMLYFMQKYSGFTLRLLELNGCALKTIRCLEEIL